MAEMIESQRRILDTPTGVTVTSAEAQCLRVYWMFVRNTLPESTKPTPPFVTTSTAPDFIRFQTLAKQWREERGATSSITEMAMCPSYQKIIAMGDSVVPFILRELAAEGDEPDQWFWALRVITDIDPVTDEIRGNFKLMAQAWLRVLNRRICGA